jgi:hypothetical protein
MNTEQQRIKIAEACGWDTQHVWFITPEGQNAASLPDYLNDLNAMAEAEKVLFSTSDWKVNQYVEILTNRATGWAWRATATQRAEAFLRTLGLWEEAK